MSNTTLAAHLTTLPTWVLENNLAQLKAIIEDRIAAEAPNKELAVLHLEAAAIYWELANK